MKRPVLLRFPIFFILTIFAFQTVSAQKSVARRWNELMLQGIREDFARPPANARNLFHVSMAMYDAWAAYDTTGTSETLFLGKTLGTYTCQYDGVPIPADIEAARRKAMSYAAYRILVRRFSLSPNAFATITRFNDYMEELGYDTGNFSTDYTNGDPAALGNYLGYCIIFYSNTDGANEQNNYINQYYAPVNPPLDLNTKGDPTILDVNRWQPLDRPGAVDQNGNPIPAVQVFQMPEWGNVVPFALKPEDKDTFMRAGHNWYVYHDPGPPPMLDTSANGDPSEAFKWNFTLVASWNSHLDPTDGVMWDISPASIGNNQTPFPQTIDEYKAFYKFNDGGITGASGRTLNPRTGQPYTPEFVPRGDYTRVLAQFWADGPSSETPPGHWFTILNDVMDHPAFVRKFNGKGDVLDTLEYDAKAYLILGGAVHDAAIAAWGIKGYYDNGRPVTALRYMADRGQCTDSMLPHYDPAGVPLIPGRIELVEAGDPLEGTAGANIGKIKFYIWKGFDFIGNPMNDFAGVGWILAEDWWPYQRITFVTPPFAGYISGHSTFSRASAEALTLLTGDEYFPGGLGEYHIAANSNFLGLEKGPSVDVTLQWATYRDASDETSLSRIWGSIHPPVDDIPGRIIGIECGTGSYYKARDLYYNDDDGDGYYSYEDCDDHNPAIHPGAPDICDGLDNDCDGLIDKGYDMVTYYLDADGDGFGDPDISLDTCFSYQPMNFVDNALDCDDNNPEVHPGATEICDNLDNDCDGMIDDSLTMYTYYRDNDGDGFGTDGNPIVTCIDQVPGGFSTNALDCDDDNPEIYPGAMEICDNLDNDCDGMIDDSLTVYGFYLDADGDGFGTSDSVLFVCLNQVPNGFAEVDGDCDDNNPDVYPDAPEICDDLDNNCDGSVDEGLPLYIYYTDGDGDGYGNPDLPIMTCLFPSPFPYVDNGLDCNDDAPGINPGETEVFGDGIDNNCDGLVDSVSSTRNITLEAFSYPNPVHDVLNIQADFEGPMSMELSNANGSLIRSGEVLFSQGTARINFAEEVPGVYVLRLLDRIHQKLILLRVVKM
ncbi:MAG: MopE-related protein [Saprospiraceae bacterium]